MRFLIPLFTVVVVNFSSQALANSQELEALEKSLSHKTGKLTSSEKTPQSTPSTSSKEKDKIDTHCIPPKKKPVSVLKKKRNKSQKIVSNPQKAVTPPPLLPVSMETFISTIGQKDRQEIPQHGRELSNKLAVETFEETPESLLGELPGPKSTLTDDQFSFMQERDFSGNETEGFDLSKVQSNEESDK